MFSGLIAGIIATFFNCIGFIANLLYQVYHDKKHRVDELIYKQRVTWLNDLRLTVAKYERSCTALNWAIREFQHKKKYINDEKNKDSISNNKGSELKQLLIIKDEMKSATDDWQEQETLLQLYLTTEKDSKAQKILDIIARINQKQRDDLIPSNDLNEIIVLASQYCDEQMKQIRDADGSSKCMMWSTIKEWFRSIRKNF